jgi:DNA-binding transcriptional LysR family regulator
MLDKLYLYFFECAQSRSYSAAARKLSITQGALSQAILRLEENLKVRLLERSAGRGKLEVTAAGEQLVESIKRFQLDFQSRVLPDLHGASYPLRIACVDSIGIRYLLPLLMKSPSRYHWYFVPRQRQLLQGLEALHYDLTILSIPRAPVGFEHELIDRDIIRFVGEQRAFGDIEKISSAKELQKRSNIFERQPFQAEWSNMIGVQQSGYFVDDHLVLKSLVLSGLALTDYQLDYFSPAELRRLAISPAKTPWDDWKIHAVFRPDLGDEKKEILMELVKKLRHSVREGHKQMISELERRSRKA